jgi:hypothetical protein
MGQAGSIESLVRQVSREVRLRRAEHWAIRGVFWGGSAAALVLLLKGVVGAWALPLAGGLCGAGALIGAVYGLAKGVPPADAARLADRVFGLQERVATSLEWAERSDRPPLVDALVSDTAARVAGLPRQRVVRRILPKEGRLLPVPLVAVLALAVAPAVPLPSGQLPDFSAWSGQEDAEERAGTTLLEERSRPLARDPLRRPAFEERDFAQRSVTGGGATAGDLSAIFKDTSLATQRPDFNSFLKKGDERLRMLEQVDRLPDLQSDFTTSQYKMVFRKSKALSGGLRPDISPQKLRELLEEMERLGRKGGNWSGDAAEGMEALDYGHQDKALEAMEKALNKMRAMEEQQRAGKSLRGGRDSERGGMQGRDGRGGPGADDQDFGEGEGLLPGKGKSGAPKGEASQRLRASPYDVGVEGQARRGRKDAYDTNMTGRGGPMNSRLQYLGVIGQYRKMMEDAITREQIPRDYHAQIKDYFQALDER